MSILTGQDALAKLRSLHPLIVEGSGRADQRNPDEVAAILAGAIKQHWQRLPTLNDAAPVLVIQGDPLEERGISAITRRVAATLGIARCLVTLDDYMDPDHSKWADRHGVELEMRYSEMASVLSVRQRSDLNAAIDIALLEKNQARMAESKPPLAAYYLDFALLQEVTKASCKQLCGGVTIAHTIAVDEIIPSSVTSFYKVGLAQGLYDAEDLVAFAAQ